MGIRDSLIESLIVIIFVPFQILMHGHPLKALDQACQNRLWGHAFALALRLGPGPLDRVMEKFLARSVNPSDPLLTLYQLTAGEIPRSVDQFAYASGKYVIIFVVPVVYAPDPPLTAVK